MNSTVFDRLTGGTALRTMLLDAATTARAGAGGGVGDSGRGGSGVGVTHAWLFTGAPGSGRTIAARALAAGLVCTSPEVAGCGICPSCRAVLGGTHPDVELIQPQELTTGVKFARDVVEKAHTLPTSAPWRVIIFEDADRMTESASNVLLKSVEEPPSRTIFMLCAPSTHPRDILPTIVSRCRHVYVPVPSNESVAALLVAEGGVSEHDAELAAAASVGHIGRARYLVHNVVAQQRRAQVLGLAELIYHGDVAFQEVGALFSKIETEVDERLTDVEAEEKEKLQVAMGGGMKGKRVASLRSSINAAEKELEATQKKRRTRQKRDALDLALVDFAGIYRDALITKSGAEIGLTHPDMSGLSGDIAARHPETALVACIDAIMKTRELFGQNVRPVVALDAMVGRIRLALGVT